MPLKCRPHATHVTRSRASQIQAGLQQRLEGQEVERVVRDAPFVQIPLGVTEDRLVGTVDIEASMKVVFFI